MVEGLGLHSYSYSNWLSKLSNLQGSQRLGFGVLKPYLQVVWQLWSQPLLLHCCHDLIAAELLLSPGLLEE